MRGSGQHGGRPQARRLAHAEAVITHTRGLLAGYKTPKRVVIADAAPKNPSGKILKRQLRDELRTSAQTRDSCQPGRTHLTACEQVCNPAGGTVGQVLLCPSSPGQNWALAHPGHGEPSECWRERLPLWGVGQALRARGGRPAITGVILRMRVSGKAGSGRPALEQAGQ